MWLFSPDGTEQLLFFDEDNSPLLDNNVTALGIHPNTGEVFIGTEKGIISYRGEATSAEVVHQEEVIVFPNPVRENYRGPIAIKGLARDADVKIADINGHVVFQTRAFGGQATDWTPPRGLSLIATYGQPATDWSARRTLTSEAAKPGGPARVSPRAARSRARRVGATIFAIVMIFVIWIVWSLAT